MGAEPASSGELPVEAEPDRVDEVEARSVWRLASCASPVSPAQAGTWLAAHAIQRPCSRHCSGVNEHMSINDEIRKAVSAYFSTLSAMDVEAWLALFEPDATGHDPGIPLLVGHDQLRRFFDGLLDHFAAFSVVPEEIFSCDSGAAARWRAQATTKAGHDVAFSGIETFEISAEGKIQSVRAYWDPAGLVAQLKS